MSWGTLLSVVIGAVIGFLGTAGGEWARFYFTHRQQQAERRETFQRDTVLALQEAALALMQATFAIVAEGSSPTQLEAYRSAQYRIAVLQVRVPDTSLQQLAESVRQAATKLVFRQQTPESPEEAQRASQPFSDAFESLNQRIGKLLARGKSS